MRALPLLLVAACAVPEVEYLGKRCETSCPASLTCIDGECHRLESAVYVSGFRFDWATPNSLRWAWTLEGPGAALASYELELKREGANPATVVLTSAELAELGGYQLRRSEGFDVLTGVITPSLEPGTVYSASLRVNDVHGKQFVTRTVRGTTDEPRTRRIQVFDDEVAPGAYLLPQSPAFSRASSGGVGESASLHYRASLDPESGFENLRVSGLNERAGPTLTSKLFASAYLEWWTRGKGTPSSSWCDVWLRLAPDATHLCVTDFDCLWRFSGKWVYRPDPAGAVLQRVQVPLGAFERGGEPLTLADLERPITEVNVGLPFFADTDEVNLDGVMFFW